MKDFIGGNMKKTLAFVFAVFILFCCVLPLTAGAADQAAGSACVQLASPAEGTGLIHLNSYVLGKNSDSDIQKDTVNIKADAADDGADNPDGINTNKATTWIIIVSAVFFCAIVAVVISLLNPFSCF